MSKIIDAINQENLKQSVPEFAVGDTVRVMVKVIEGDRERLQAFEGIVIARKNGGISETFTVRRLSFGIGVEKTFPIHSPKVADIQVIRKGKVRRAKLYYLRERTGKAAKLKSPQDKFLRIRVFYERIRTYLTKIAVSSFFSFTFFAKYVKL